MDASSEDINRDRCYLTALSFLFLAYSTEGRILRINLVSEVLKTQVEVGRIRQQEGIRIMI